MADNKPHTITWEGLAIYANSLSKEQRALPVIICGENGTWTVLGAEQFNGVQINPSGEGWEPLSDYQKEDPENYPADIDLASMCENYFPENTVVLYING